MKKIITLVTMFAILFLTVSCQGPLTMATQDEGIQSTENDRGTYGASDRNIVMLEGFHWKSASDVPNGWYNIINSNAARIAGDGINMVWYPPVSDAGSTEGYLPRQLNLFTNAYGNVTNLKTSIATLKANGVVSIADIVINHRVGSTGWADFTNPTWGATTTTNYTVVKDDEWTGIKSVNNDTGDAISAARDLDHKNPTVQEGIKTWLASVKALGFQGWRYDMVVGFGASYIGMYNDATSPTFSVGEYWNDDAQTVVNWIDGTHSVAAKRSTAFDFPYRRNLYNAIVNNHYNWLGTSNTKNISGVVGKWAEKAVTFLENHDTEEARGGAYTSAFPNGDPSLRGYAIILTHPGTPMVFWKDLMDSGAAQELAIKRMISVRKNYGILNNSAIWVDTATDGGFYSAYITGTAGEVAVKVGPGTWQPSGTKWANPGTKLLYSGNNWAIWGSGGKLSGKTWP